MLFGVEELALGASELTLKDMGKSATRTSYVYIILPQQDKGKQNTHRFDEIMMGVLHITVTSQ